MFIDRKYLITVPNVSDSVQKSAYVGMVLRQVASHAFRRNSQDVIFLKRKLSLNIDRVLSGEFYLPPDNGRFLKILDKKSWFVGFAKILKN